MTCSPKPEPAASRAGGRRAPSTCRAAIPASWPPSASGAAAVQDEGSQLVALALAAVDAPGPVTIDLAAGPGGKAALLAALGMDVTGLELHETRAQLVARSGVRVAVGDGRVPPLRAGSADRVLLDAPCSGLGALRRRPEARWRRTAADIEPLAVLQEELLVSALRLVRPGGVVAYATCSPHPRETAGVLDAVLRDPPVPVERDRRPAAAAAGHAGPRAGPHRPALAAPPRHRRDVPGACCAARQD